MGVSASTPKPQPQNKTPLFRQVKQNLKNLIEERRNLNLKIKNDLEAKNDGLEIDDDFETISSKDKKDLYEKDLQIADFLSTINITDPDLAAIVRNFIETCNKDHDETKRTLMFQNLDQFFMPPVTKKTLINLLEERMNLYLKFESDREDDLNNPELKFYGISAGLNAEKLYEIDETIANILKEQIPLESQRPPSVKDFIEMANNNEKKGNRMNYFEQQTKSLKDMQTYIHDLINPTESTTAESNINKGGTKKKNKKKCIKKVKATDLKKKRKRVVSKKNKKNKKRTHVSK